MAAAARPSFLTFTPLFGAAVVVRRIPTHVLFVIGVFTSSHIAAMALVAPWTYGYRSILPLQAAFHFGAVYLLPGPERDESPRG